MKEKHNSDFTAVVRDEYGVHILKCKILDKHELLFQMLNKTKNILLPVYRIKADYGMLKMIKPDAFWKEREKEQTLTENVRRKTLLCYYSQFKLHYLINAYHETVEH
jgi:hypothetical protein